MASCRGRSWEAEAQVCQLPPESQAAPGKEKHGKENCCHLAPLSLHTEELSLIAGKPQGVVFPKPQSLGIPPASLPGKFQVQRFLSLCLTRTHNINNRRGCGGNKVINCWCHQSRVQGPRLQEETTRVPSHQQQSSCPKPQYSQPMSQEFAMAACRHPGPAGPGESQGDPFTSRASCG